MFHKDRIRSEWIGFVPIVNSLEQPELFDFINIYLSFEPTPFYPGPGRIRSVVCPFQMTVSTTPSKRRPPTHQSQRTPSNPIHVSHQSVYAIWTNYVITHQISCRIKCLTLVGHTVAVLGPCSRSVHRRLPM